ncbi:MAG: hypothetical protein ABIB43_00545 [archaeon]
MASEKEVEKIAKTIVFGIKLAVYGTLGYIAGMIVNEKTYTPSVDIKHQVEGIYELASKYDLRETYRFQIPDSTTYFNKNVFKTYGYFFYDLNSERNVGITDAENFTLTCVDTFKAYTDDEMRERRKTKLYIKG